MACMQVLTACSLASFSLADCTQSLLGRRLEVLSPKTLETLPEEPKRVAEIERAKKQ